MYHDSINCFLTSEGGVVIVVPMCSISYRLCARCTCKVRFEVVAGIFC